MNLFFFFQLFSAWLFFLSDTLQSNLKGTIIFSSIGSRSYISHEVQFWLIFIWNRQQWNMRLSSSIRQLKVILFGTHTMGSPIFWVHISFWTKSCTLKSSIVSFISTFCFEMQLWPFLKIGHFVNISHIESTIFILEKATMMMLAN